MKKRMKKEEELLLRSYTPSSLVCLERGKKLIERGREMEGERPGERPREPTASDPWLTRNRQEK